LDGLEGPNHAFDVQEDFPEIEVIPELKNVAVGNFPHLRGV
jgi:hypothetical protein